MPSRKTRVARRKSMRYHKKRIHTRKQMKPRTKMRGG